VPVTARVLGDVRETLPKVAEMLRPAEHIEWLNEFKSCYDKEFKAVINGELFPSSGPLKMGEVIHKVSEATGNNAVLVTDVGQHQMMAVRYFKYNRSRSVVTSGGLGTMGFGLPAAIGAKYGTPDRAVCLFVGDGGIQMTIQELGTIMQYNIDVKIIILNNHYLGMVRQWQELFFNERYSETVMKNPDFAKIGEAYNIPSRKVETREELDKAVAEIVNHKGAFLLDVQVETKGMVYPMVPAGTPVTNILLGNE
jgi:acetolactate synthase-1/2/3 large subunit